MKIPPSTAFHLVSCVPCAFLLYHSITRRNYYQGPRPLKEREISADCMTNTHKTDVICEQTGRRGKVTRTMPAGRPDITPYDSRFCDLTKATQENTDFLEPCPE
jgi:hypothetical protein